MDEDFLNTIDYSRVSRQMAFYSNEYLEVTRAHNTLRLLLGNVPRGTPEYESLTIENRVIDFELWRRRFRTVMPEMYLVLATRFTPQWIFVLMLIMRTLLNPNPPDPSP